MRQAKDSIKSLREEKTFKGIGFKAKDVVVAIAACDRVSGLNLFPGLQKDNQICGPNPRRVMDLINQLDLGRGSQVDDDDDENASDEDECEEDERYQQQLADFHQPLKRLLPRKVVIRGVDVVANLQTVTSQCVWTQLILCMWLALEEVRICGNYRGKKRTSSSAGPSAKKSKR